MHAKALVMDDRLLRGRFVQSQQPLAKGYDTECDLSVEVPPGERERSCARRSWAFATICSPSIWGWRTKAVESGDCRFGVTDRRYREPAPASGRTLVPFDPPEPQRGRGRGSAKNDLMDRPERPSRACGMGS